MPGRPLAGVASASTTDASASTADFPAAARPTRLATAAQSTTGGLFSARNFYVGLTVVALAVGALSLLIPSTPSYDPWSWLLWGREIVHGHLTITTGGTSWKPLPMIFTIPFALFGHAAPDLWLVVARAGAVAAVVMVFALAYRLTRRVGGLFGEARDDLGRLTAIAPALLAGLIGAVALTLSASGGFVSSNALGYSEGLATALLLISMERHLDGHPRQAFVVGFFVALDRPETWLFWGPYGLWLFWTRSDLPTRMLVAASAVLVLICWFVPVKLGCGSFGCSVTRAVHPRSNSYAFASDPFVAELKKAAWPTMLLRIKLVAALLVLAVTGILWRTHRRAGTAGLLTAPSRARLTAALIGLGGLAWFVVIAVMTQVGFSGNNRYLVLGAAMVDICGAVGFGWAAQELAVLAPRLLRTGRRGPASGPSASGTPGSGTPGSGTPGSGTQARNERRAAVGGHRPGGGGLSAGPQLGRLQPDLGPPYTWVARLPGEPAPRSQRARNPVRRPWEGSGLRQRDDRGLPGPDGGVDPERAHDAHRGAAGDRHPTGPRSQRDPADPGHALRGAAALPVRLAVGALSLPRDQRPLPPLHQLPQLTVMPIILRSSR